MTNRSDLHVVDPHALVWYLTEDRKLPLRAVRLLQAAERSERELHDRIIAATHACPERQ